MKSRQSLLAVIAGGVLLIGVSSQAQTYAYQRLNVPGVIPSALEITDDGRVGGWTTDFIHLNGFLVSNGVYTSVSVAGYSTTQVTAVGGSTLYGVVNQNSGFSLTGGKVTIFRPSGYAALPRGVNGKGVVVGGTQVANGPAGGFVLQNGAFKSFLYPGSDVTTFAAINDLGVIVGTWNKSGGPLQSFALSNGQTTPVMFPGAYSTIVTGINDAGEMVGWYLPVPQAAPVLFRYDGTSFSNIPLPANSYACSTGHVNNNGDFVGTCADQTTKQEFAFLATLVETKEIVLPPQ